MGGIAGIIYPDVFQLSQLLTPMLDTLAYRGSNSREEHTFRHTQVGVCGSLLNPNKSKIAAGMDGVLSNAKELISELKTAGFTCMDETNGEILANAYICWGTEFVKHLQGDFALFILDQQKERLILARDRIGKKPLYWYQNNECFIFASELKAILATGTVPQTPALDALSAYLYLGYIPQDMSPIKDVNKLLPGHYLKYNSNRSIHIAPYWSYGKLFQGNLSDDKNKIISNIDEMLQESVSQRIPETSQLGCIVSGGLGSASIAYYLQKLAPSDKIKTLTVSFKGENEQDGHAAKNVSDSLNLQQDSEIITSQNFLDDFVKIVWCLDEPLADPNVLATWRLAKMAQPLKTVFSGMGSDELLAGHSRYTLAERKSSFKDRALQACMPIVKNLLLPVLALINKQTVFNILQRSKTNPWHSDYLNRNALFNDNVRSAASPKLGKLFDPIVFLHKFHNLPLIKSNVASYMYFDVKTRLPDSFMMQYERLTSAHGLEWKTPFLSEKLIEYTAQLHTSNEMKEESAFFVLKHILKDTFPSNILNRPKKTRKHFLESWATTPEITKLFQLLSQGSLVENGIISKEWIDKQLKTPHQQKESFRYLWSILTLEIWFRLFINRAIQPQPPSISVSELLRDLS
jgi:asparagine synthase (glutamine-hydrolysing)